MTKNTPSIHQTTAKDPTAPRELTRVIGQSEQIKATVKDCADELAWVNSAFKGELSLQPQTGLAKALAQNEVVESKVKACADDLAKVTGALQDELKEREVLEHELAAAQEQEKSARDAAFHDPLTSLPNRSLFNDRLEQGLAQAKRHDRTLAVMFIDLNGFKAINDKHGHSAGDNVLKEIASRLIAMTREDDTVSRHGGDEFLYLLLEINLKADVAAIATKFVEELGRPCEVNANGTRISLNVGCSVGIALFPGDGETSDALVTSADRAMYRAKRERTGYAFAAATGGEVAMAGET